MLNLLHLLDLTDFPDHSASGILQSTGMCVESRLRLPVSMGPFSPLVLTPVSMASFTSRALIGLVFPYAAVTAAIKEGEGEWTAGYRSGESDNPINRPVEHGKL